MRAATAIGIFLLSAGNAHAIDRDTSLITTFRVLCAQARPAFAQINQRAEEMKLPVRKDSGQSRSKGQFAHSKSWMVNLTDGPLELVAAEANGPKLHVVSCGIAATDPNAGAFRKALVAEMKLRRSFKESLSPDRSFRTSTWRDAFGKGTTLRLVDATPQGKPGAMLYYDVVGAQRR